MPSFLTTPNKSLNKLLLITFSAYVLLVSVFIYLCISHDQSSWKLLIFQLFPLLIVLPGILQQHYRAYSWMCFIMLAYFTAYVVEVSSHSGDYYDWFRLILSIIIFSGAMMSSRGLQREQHTE